MRKLFLKSLYTQNIKSNAVSIPNSPQTEEAINILVSLLEESEPSDSAVVGDVLASFESNSCANNESSNTTLNFKLKSDKFPSFADNVALATFVNQVTNHLKKMRIHKKGGNLSSKEITALRSLCAQHSLTIKQADKRGNIVVMSNTQYKAMCLKILHNETWYKKITAATVSKYYEAFYTLVNYAFSRGAIHKGIWEFYSYQASDNSNTILPA